MSSLQLFLTGAVRREWRAWAQLPDTDDQTLNAWASRLQSDATLRETLLDGESRLFGVTRNTAGWPDSPFDEATCDALYGLLGLLAIPRIAEGHKARGIETAVSRGVCAGIGIAVAQYRKGYGGGAWGVERGLLDWWRLIASGELYRLGRLEYNPRTYRGVAVALRHRDSQSVVALSDDGILYDGDGYAVTDAGNPPPGTWEASLYEDEDSITGHIIPPTGLALRQKARLQKPDWTIVLRPGDSVLDVHIPAGQPLDTDSTRASLLDAVGFFSQHPPQRAPRAFICHSWLLDPAWDRKLPPDSRIRQWARQPYRFPVASGTGDGLYFVFARHEIDPLQTAAATRLEHAMRDAVAHGEPLRSGGMFLLMEDATRWGLEPYRTDWAMVPKFITEAEELQ